MAGFRALAVKSGVW